MGKQKASPIAADEQRHQHAGFIGRALPVSGAAVAGWSCDPTAPGQPVALSVVIDGAVIGEITCDEPLVDRPAALNGTAGEARGFHYEVAPEYRDGEQHAIAFRHSGGSAVMFSAPDGSQAATTAFSVQPGTEIEGFVDGLVAGGIAGWAVRRDLVNGKASGGVELLVTCDNEPIQRITADRFRPDVGAAKGCEPNVGFNFQPPPRFRTGTTHTFSFHAIPENTRLHNSPFVTSFPTLDTMSSLHALHELARTLCAEIWSMERKIHQMISIGPDTVTVYDGWARRNIAALGTAVAARRAPSARTASRRNTAAPLVSVVMPTYRPDIGNLRAAIDSVRGQTFRNWELLIVDDSSRSAKLSAFLRDVVATDNRIRVMRHTINRGISAATNTAVATAVGEFVALLDHDDLLVDVALEVMVDAARRSGAELLYSDEDKIDERGNFSEPHFKPDFNWRLLLGMNYLCHLTMVNRQVLRKAGPMLSEFDGAQDHDLVLRLTEILDDKQIRHVPEVLYHWRKSAGSTAQSAGAKPYTVEAGIGAVRQHLRRRGFAEADVTSVNGLTMYSVDWRLKDEPSVVIVIPFRDQAEATKKCIDMLFANTAYRNFRVVLVDNWSTDPATLALCAEAAGRPGVSVMRFEEPFNYSRLNNLAVSAHKADCYVFLNNDVYITQLNWLRIMVDEVLADPKVGIVGTKLIYPNGTLQHAGVVLGVGGIADHVFKGQGQNEPGYVGRALLSQQYAAVTGAMMLCRADVFAAAGQFDEAELSIAFNDVDLCLKAGKAGYKVVWSADVIAEHHESLSRGLDESVPRRARFFHEHQIIMQRWGEVLSQDPFYNKNFSRQGGMFRELSDPALPQP
jgi:GT2 family glycosyltransferase